MTALQTIAKVAAAVLAAAVFSPQALAGIPIVSWQHASGAQVFLVESPAIPMLDVQIDVDGGSRRDPAAQAGLASATAAMSAKGVQAMGPRPALDENALSEAWADLGASFCASASADRLSFGWRTLTYPDLLDKSVALAAQQLARPSWPADIWTTERQRWQAAIKEADTRPATRAGKAYSAAVYGSHPYGFEVTAQTLDRIEVGDMRAFYARTVLPCRARISLVGAITRAQADALVSRLMQPLEKGPCAALAAVTQVQPLQQAQNLAVPFESAQAHVLIGQPGITRADPDFFAMLVGNYILGGGGFVSQLTTEVREKRGLSYSVFSTFNPGLHAGAFTVSLQTRPDQAAQAVAVTREVLRNFVAQGPTQAELQAAKDNLIGGFALRIDTNRKLLDNVANIAAHHLPLDYLDTWTARVEKITVGDVKAAFARHLQPDRMVTVVLGGKP
jgi:zinc protease